MSKFESIEQLNNVFKSGQLETLPKDFTIGEVDFFERDVIFPKLMSDMSNGKKIISIFSSRAQAAKDRVALVWGMKPGLKISPLLAKMVGLYRSGTEDNVMREAVEKKEEPTIGTHVELVLVSFNDNEPIRGKVDTGATINSLHAESINIHKDPLDPESQVVEFVFDGKKYSMGLEQQQSVQSADGGVSYRPIVKFSVKYDGQVFPDVLFNLNDRGDMEDKLLVGMNLLEEIGYKIDPKKESEEPIEDTDIITEEELAYIVEEIEKELESLQEDCDSTLDNVHVLYEYLLEQNITFADLLRHVKTHTIQIVERLEP